LVDPVFDSQSRRCLGVVVWVGCAGLMAFGALLGTLAPRHALDWQPGLAFGQPWRWFSAAAVHYGAAHLGVNLLGAALVGALGWAARVPAAMAVAWLLAWPLTHLALLLQSELSHYGGLSGVQHTGVAVVAAHLVCDRARARRIIGAVMAALLAAKVASEAPWEPVFHAGLGIMIAPLAHATGAVAGAVCALLCGAIAAQAARRRAHRGRSNNAGPR
jgi:rhomboid family GlyGly-CTERM serine protease